MMPCSSKISLEFTIFPLILARESDAIYSAFSILLSFFQFPFLKLEFDFKVKVSFVLVALRTCQVHS
jgi:hypothetical protein